MESYVVLENDLLTDDYDEMISIFSEAKKYHSA